MSMSGTFRSEDQDAVEALRCHVGLVWRRLLRGRGSDPSSH